ncbi:Late embryogenesis abundant protein [Trema orientale]|uniref:Late embryogenesis abundant protein n=1 Tax=Trema orientale TaxID=63057 RepID=A0A2P5BI63_TREOI|nr:Late embryogenesis abundant protein [Trema orientale]
MDSLRLSPGVDTRLHPEEFLSSSVARARATASSRSVAKKAGEDGASENVAWVPDPITGYYRPENGAQEIDVAELRAMLLKKYEFKLI